MDNSLTLKILVRLNLHYPQAQRTPSELQVLAKDWAEDLQGYSDVVVLEAVKRYRRVSPYFPTIADILLHCREVEEDRQRERDRLALPVAVGVSPERAKWWIRKILKREG